MFKSISAFLDFLGSDNERDDLAEDQVQLATAALMFHAIAIDGMVREDEMARLKNLLTSHFQLEERELNRLLTLAQQREREAIDIYRFTSVLRDKLSLDEKRTIVAMMWRLVYADGELAPLEDNLVWRTAELLAVPARDRMELKRAVRTESE
ncbi:MAG: TerB family tellurite resistance protein [Rhodomicrobium sp.]|nr:TerB family tellurite resistance protein [Rhodomicrobium sp.]